MALRGALRLLALLALALAAGAQFPKKEKVKAPAVKSDIKCGGPPLALRRHAAAKPRRRRYIRCGVCQELAKNLARELKELREAKGAKARAAAAHERQRPSRRARSRRGRAAAEGVGRAREDRAGAALSGPCCAISAEALSDWCRANAAQACDPDTTAGEWLAKLDLVEAGTRLKVVEQPRPGKCGTECRTAARACLEALGDRDTDLAEAIFAQRADVAASGRAALERLICRELGDACAAPPPPLPRDRPAGPPFEEMSEQEAEMEKLMRSMSGIPGMPGERRVAFRRAISP